MHMDDLVQRHKNEKKTLNAQIQSLKHSVPKGDKKKKKEITNKIALLQSELEERHSQELLEFSNSNGQTGDDKLENLCLSEDDVKIAGSETPDQPPPKISKAQKRREKKEAEERARQALWEDDGTSINSSRNKEASLFEQIMKENSLIMHDVDPDGNCLYNAVAVGLQGTTSEETLKRIRTETCDYMLEHMNDFLPFTSNTTTGDMLSIDEYKQYCNDIRDTNSWGGELELRAISQFSKTPIEVYQAEAPKLLIGSEFEGKPIRLSYHRYQYGLGEHYNALLIADT